MNLWTVEFTPEAKQEFHGLPADMQAAALHIARLLQSMGPERVREPYVKPVEGKLWEMRLHGRNGIARALYRDAAYLVLDEATNALDPGTEAQVLAVLENIRGSRTILVIAHRLSSLQRCDRVVFIEDGRVVADGSCEALLRDSVAFRRFANTGDAHDVLQT